MYSPRPVPKPPNQGSSARSTEATPVVYASYPHDTFMAPKSASICADPFGVGRGTAGAKGVAANPVPPRC